MIWKTLFKHSSNEPMLKTQTIFIKKTFSRYIWEGLVLKTQSIFIFLKHFSRCSLKGLTRFKYFAYCHLISRCSLEWDVNSLIPLIPHSSILLIAALFQDAVWNEMVTLSLVWYPIQVFCLLPPYFPFSRRKHTVQGCPIRRSICYQQFCM